MLGSSDLGSGEGEWGGDGEMGDWGMGWGWEESGEARKRELNSAWYKG